MLCRVRSTCVLWCIFATIRRVWRASDPSWRQMKSCDDSRAGREAMYRKLEALGYDVGRRLTERCVEPYL